MESDNEKFISLYPDLDPDPDIIYPYVRGIDNSSVRCICSIPFDDGATIQCDGCFVWQHMICMEIEKSSIPKTYYCEECNPRIVDVAKAVAGQNEMQKQRRAERVAGIQNILVKRGIMDKPSPKKRNQGRGRKTVLASPRKQVKTMVKPVLKKEEGVSPVIGHGGPQRTGGAGTCISIKEFPFKTVVCVDDWTNGFLGES